jgi:transcriptional regulator with XRE-family HTH domain
MNILVKPAFASKRIGCAAARVYLCDMREKPGHFLREWRQFRNKTLVQVAEHLHMTHGNLSKIERGIVPYNQDLLDALADLYMCEPPDLIIRNPVDLEGIWSVWDNAKPGDRAKILSIARTIVGEESKAS